MTIRPLPFASCVLAHENVTYMSRGPGTRTEHLPLAFWPTMYHLDIINAYSAILNVFCTEMKKGAIFDPTALQ